MQGLQGEVAAAAEAALQFQQRTAEELQRRFGGRSPRPHMEGRLGELQAAVRGECAWGGVMYMCVCAWW